MNWTCRITQGDYESLHAHLHRSDEDEHAAFLYAGVRNTSRGSELLIRRVVPVADHDFGPSDRGGYRQISARALTRAAVECEAEGSILVWAHSHPSAVRHVGFSQPDQATHERAHPHMIDMTGGKPVASLVLGTESAAGEIWMPNGAVKALDHLDVVGARMSRLTASPLANGRAGARFARQILMFGAAGQEALKAMKVAVIGAGGGGSLLVQGLAHLGVGQIVVLDFDRVSVSNLSRIVGAVPRDAMRGNLKVAVMQRLVKAIDPDIAVTAIAGDVTYAADAEHILDSDYIFSATDTQFARFAVNAICHQFLIPGAQVGAKVVTNKEGDVQLAYAMHRPLDLDGPCLECGGAIDLDALRLEQLSDDERHAQEYMEGGESPIADPSVITLNSVAASLAMLDFQFAVTGMYPKGIRLGQRVYHAPERALRERIAKRRTGCRWCDRNSASSVFARGADGQLPLRLGPPPRPAPRGLIERIRSWRV